MSILLWIYNSKCNKVENSESSSIFVDYNMYIYNIYTIRSACGYIFNYHEKQHELKRYLATDSVVQDVSHIRIFKQSHQETFCDDVWIEEWKIKFYDKSSEILDSEISRTKRIRRQAQV